MTTPSMLLDAVPVKCAVVTRTNQTYGPPKRHLFVNATASRVQIALSERVPDDEELTVKTVKVPRNRLDGFKRACVWLGFTSVNVSLDEYVQGFDPEATTPPIEDADTSVATPAPTELGDTTKIVLVQLEAETRMSLVEWLALGTTVQQATEWFASQDDPCTVREFTVPSSAMPDIFDATRRLLYAGVYDNAGQAKAHAGWWWAREMGDAAGDAVEPPTHWTRNAEPSPKKAKVSPST